MRRAALVFLVFCWAACARGPARARSDAIAPPAENPVVLIKTSMGDIYAELFPDEAPKAVANFIDLAEGFKEWTDPRGGGKQRRPFYDGLLFYRVSDNFMIAGGCPLGDGSSGPGYAFEDEINAEGLGLHRIPARQPNGMPHPWTMKRSWAGFVSAVAPLAARSLGIDSQQELADRSKEVAAKIDSLTLKDVLELQGYRFNPALRSRPPQRGTLAMDNSGPNTNGSRFFIHIGDADWLTGKHTVFGAVIKGQWFVDQIGKVIVGSDGKPKNPVTILSIRRVPRPL